MANLGLFLLKYLPLSTVDSLLVILSKMVYGDVTKYGVARPSEGPFYMKAKCGKYPVIDVGTYQKIKSGQLKVRFRDEIGFAWFTSIQYRLEVGTSIILKL